MKLMRSIAFLFLAIVAGSFPVVAHAEPPALEEQVRNRIAAIEDQIVCHWQLAASARGGLTFARFALADEPPVAPEPPALEVEIRKRIAAIEDKLIAWRRDIHEHPELGDQEVRTAKLVADHLRKLGL